LHRRRRERYKHNPKRHYIEWASVLLRRQLRRHASPRRHISTATNAIRATSCVETSNDVQACANTQTKLVAYRSSATTVNDHASIIAANSINDHASIVTANSTNDLAETANKYAGWW
jgi:hypothetical protein